MVSRLGAGIRYVAATPQPKVAWKRAARWHFLYNSFTAAQIASYLRLPEPGAPSGEIETRPSHQARAGFFVCVSTVGLFFDAFDDEGAEFRTLIAISDELLVFG